MLASKWMMFLGYDRCGATALDYVPKKLHPEWCKFLKDFLPTFLKIYPDGGVRLAPSEEKAAVTLSLGTTCHPEQLLQQVFTGLSSTFAFSPSRR
jgi:hypothetical protein